MSLTDAQLARVYNVHRKQVARWRERGLSIESPAQLLVELSRQTTPGGILARLAKPEVLSETITTIHKLTSH